MLSGPCSIYEVKKRSETLGSYAQQENPHTGAQLENRKDWLTVISQPTEGQTACPEMEVSFAIVEKMPLGD